MKERAVTTARTTQGTENEPIGLPPAEPAMMKRPKPSRLRFGASVALTLCVTALVYSWIGQRELSDTLSGVTGIDRTAARIGELLKRVNPDATAAPESQLKALSSIRTDLNTVISVPGCSKTAQEVLLRADTLLTQAQRLLERQEFPEGLRDGPSTQLRNLLEQASGLVAEASRFERSGLGPRIRSRHRLQTAGLLLGLLALAAVLFDHRLGREQAGVDGPISEGSPFPLLLAAAIRSTDEGVLITDTGVQIGEPMILFVNDSFKTMSGFSDRELVGLPLRLLRTTCLREKEFSMLEHSYIGSKSTTMETIRWRDDGSKVHCEWHISPVREREGKVTHYISILSDVTRLREQEEAQRRSKEELMKANRQLVENQQQLIHSEKMAFLGQIAAGVAHEINNPVGYVMSNLETLSDDISDLQSGQSRSSPENEPFEDRVTTFFAETLEILEDSTKGLDRVKDIVQRLKNFARPAEDEVETADINREIEVALKIVKNELVGKCRVVQRLSELPPLDCRPGQLNQVFANLLANAAQAVPAHGTITITTEFTGAEILVKVADDGVGIEKENLSRLFAPFFTTKPPGKGTGLGLSVSYGIIQKHSGTIEVESTPGEGSTFTVRLPVPTETST